jgi:hypothetical protein
MAVFRNLCVNLRDFLCDAPNVASAQSLDFHDPKKLFISELKTHVCAHHGDFDLWMGTR